MKWFHFRDGYSGGSAKTDFDDIYIEAENEKEAAEIFYKEFGHCPYAIACECCGPNYYIVEEEEFSPEYAAKYLKGSKIIPAILDFGK